MIEKLEFYHGAALVRLIEDPRCESIAKHTCGYRVNRNWIVGIKYSTKAQSPWRFTVSEDDVARFRKAECDFGSCFIAFVCGGDGVCALSWSVVGRLLGEGPGWISAKRGFAGCYAVSGSVETLKEKVAMNRWPAIVFDEEETK